MRHRVRFLLSFFLAAFLSARAQQEPVYFPPYYPTLSGVDEYAAWHLTYPDSLLRTDTPGLAVCTLRVNARGETHVEHVEASHPAFARAAEEVVERMGNWQPAWVDRRAVDTTAVVRVSFDPDAYRERVWRQEQVLEPCRGQDVDAVPIFPDEMRRLVLGNMKWPTEAVQTAVAVCRFTVDAEGHVTDVHVLQGTHPAFDHEAARILSAFPRALPARKGGKNVPFDFFLTMNFSKLDLAYHERDREKARREYAESGADPHTEASFPGGSAAFQQLVQSSLEITPEMKAHAKQGRVVCRFEVDIDGTMRNFETVHGLDSLTDAEALRALQAVADRKWNAGSLFNVRKWYQEFCADWFTVPVFFKW